MNNQTAGPTTYPTGFAWGGNPIFPLYEDKKEDLLSTRRALFQSLAPVVEVAGVAREGLTGVRRETRSGGDAGHRPRRVTKPAAVTPSRPTGCGGATP